MLVLVCSYYHPWDVFIFMGDRKGKEPNGKGVVEKLIRVEEREAVIRICYVRERYIFNKGKNKF